MIKKFIFKILWLWLLVISGNFILAGEGDISQISLQKEKIHIKGDIIIYDSLNSKKSVEVNIIKYNNTQKLKLGSKKSLAKTSKKKSIPSAPIFDENKFKQSNPKENFSLLENDGLKAVQNNRERKHNKSVLVKSYQYSVFYEIISDGFIVNKSNHYIFNSHYKRLFCRPPPTILYS